MAIPAGNANMPLPKMPLTKLNVIKSVAVSDEDEEDDALLVAFFSVEAALSRGGVFGGRVEMGRTA